VGQESDQLIFESLDDGGLAPIDREVIMQQQYTSSFNSDEDAMNPDTKATREEIEQTRERMSETIDTISERLDPHALTQQAKDAVRGATIGRVESAAKSARVTTQNALSTTGATAKDALTAAGTTAKDAFSTAGATAKGALNTTGATAKDALTTAGVTTKDALTTAGATAGATAKNAINTAGESLSGVAHKVRETIVSVRNTAGAEAQTDGTDDVNSMQATANGNGLGEKFRSARMNIGPQFRDTAHQAQCSFREALEKKPLVVGAALVGLGALAGFAIPETEQENRLLGRIGSRLISGKASSSADQAGQWTV